MEYLDRIQAFDRRVQRLPLTEQDICKEAGVPQANSLRWRREDVSPRILTFEKQMTALEAKVTRHERSLRSFT